jgi:tRNA (guanine37-N1)-methyltransferase
MRFDIITIFPDMFTGFLSGGVLKKAVEKGLIEVAVHDLREYTRDKHKQVDDRPFGGSPGMVMKPEPIFRAVDAVKRSDKAAICLLSPQGKRFSSIEAENLAEQDQVVLICGRYEGVDERVAENCATEEISIGDYVLTGGEPAAMVLIDAIARFVPGVVGKPESVENESFSQGRLDYPQYTRPRTYRGLKVPELLFSGDHHKIDRWRRKKALEKTRRFRPAMLKKNGLSQKDKDILNEIKKREGNQ